MARGLLAGYDLQAEQEEEGLEIPSLKIDWNRKPVVKGSG